MSETSKTANPGATPAGEDSPESLRPSGLLTADLVSRLRNAEGEYGPNPYKVNTLLSEAADEIERLQGIIRTHGQHSEACDFYGDCRCELQEFER